MKVQCPNCSILNDVDETNAIDKGGSVRCKECKTKFLIRKNSGVCPLCGHIRKTNDVECPNCGIFYEKYQEYLNKKKIAEAPDFNEIEEPDNKFILKIRSIAKMFLVVTFFFCIVFGIYYIILLPKIEAETRLTEEIKLREEIKLKEELRLKEELKLKEELRLKEELEKNIFIKAYVALKEIEAATGNDIDRQKYIDRIDAALLELNLIKGHNSKRLDKLNQILDCYQGVKQLWSSIDENEKSKNQRLEEIRRRTELEQDTLKRNYETQTDASKLAFQAALLGLDIRNLTIAEKKRLQARLKYWEEENRALLKNTQEKLAIEAKAYQETAKVIKDSYVKTVDMKESVQLLWKKASELLREYEIN